MTLETFLGKGDGSDFESNLDSKEPKLPAGIRKYIRRLKEDGNWDEAMEVRKREIGKRITRGQVINNQLNVSIRTLVDSDDPVQQYVHQIRATWLLESGDVITAEERKAQLGLIIDDVYDSGLSEQVNPMGIVEGLGNLAPSN